MQPKPYYCEKCQRNHRWDSEIGANHRNHSILLFKFPIEHFTLFDVLVTHPHNPLSIQYRNQIQIVDFEGGAHLFGAIEELWLTWDGKDVQGKPTTPLGYPKEEYR